jgi:hypothetical protein
MARAYFSFEQPIQGRAEAVSKEEEDELEHKRGLSSEMIYETIQSRDWNTGGRCRRSAAPSSGGREEGQGQEGQNHIGSEALERSKWNLAKSPTKRRKKSVGKSRKATAAKKSTKTAAAKDARKKRPKIAGTEKGKPAQPPTGWNTGDDATNSVVQQHAARQRRFAAAMAPAETPPEVLGPRPMPAVLRDELAASDFTTSAPILGAPDLTENSPPPILIVPTVYPENAAGTVIVQNCITIDTQSTEFRELNAKLDELLDEWRKSNEISTEVRDQLRAEIAAGRELLTAPKTNRNMIDVLLLNPLKYIAKTFASAFIGELAKGALKLILELIQ